MGGLHRPVIYIVRCPTGRQSATVRLSNAWKVYGDRFESGCGDVIRGHPWHTHPLPLPSPPLHSVPRAPTPEFAARFVKSCYSRVDGHLERQTFRSRGLEARTRGRLTRDNPFRGSREVSVRNPLCRRMPGNFECSQGIERRRYVSTARVFTAGL